MLIAGLGGALLIAVEQTACPVWALLLAVPVVTAVCLEISARTDRPAQVSARSAAERFESSRVAGRRQASMGDLDSRRRARATVERDLSADHVATVLQFPVRTDEPRRLRAHG